MIDNQKNYVNNITIKGASEWAVTVNQAYTWSELLGGFKHSFILKVGAKDLIGKASLNKILLSLHY